jgi:hypothetical protein
MEEKRPSSPSILSVFTSRKIYRRKSTATERKNTKQTQTEYTVTDAMVYRKGSKKGELSYSTRHLPNIDFYDRRPSDVRNEDFAKSGRQTFKCLSTNLNLIRLLRCDPDLDQVLEFVPINSESEGGETEEERPIPLNVIIKK